MRKEALLSLLFILSNYIFASNSLIKGYWVDTSSNANIFEVMDMDSNQFKETEKKLIFGGSSDNALWLKITPGAQTEKKNYIILTNAHLDTVYAYKVMENGTFIEIHTGDHFIFTKREIEFNYFGFIFTPNLKSIYIRIKSEGQLSSTVELYSEDEFFKFFRKFNSLIFFYIGIALITIVLNIFLYLRLKDKLFLYYSFSAIAFLLFTLIDKGILFQQIWPNFPEINKFMIVFYCIPVGILTFFSYRFLNIKREKNPVIYIFYIIIFSILFFSIVFNIIIGYALALELYLLASYFMIILFISSSIYNYLKTKEQTTLLFLFAWIIYMFASLLYILAYYDILPMTFTTEYSIQFAHISDIILLFIAVMEKVSRIRDDKEEITRNLIYTIEEKKEILEDQTLKLEKLVRERTLELEVINDELETTNEELEATNEELYSKNEIINKQNEELKSTLNYLKEAQVQLIQSEKMASLGILTAGVAHELNNPLNFISGAYEGLKNYFKDNQVIASEAVPILLNSIKTGVERATEIVVGLNQFSRHNKLMNEECNIHSIIENCLAILYNQYKNRIDVKKKLNAKKNCIQGNVGKLHQVFINIISNAIQSISDKGEIRIKTEVENNYIRIEISDTGCGIERVNMDKITDPFFTTKDPGKGTGLGLSISYSIIEEHHGKLKFQSEIKKGTIVKIDFPLKLK